VPLFGEVACMSVSNREGGPVEEDGVSRLSSWNFDLESLGAIALWAQEKKWAHVEFVLGMPQDDQHLRV